MAFQPRNATSKRSGVLGKISKNLKNKTKIRNRYKRPDRYQVYIGDRFVGDKKVPMFGTIDKTVIDSLGIKPSSLLSGIPNAGKYVSAEGLNIDYTVIDGILWKATTGTSDGKVYNTTLPVPMRLSQNKLKIRVLDKSVVVNKTKVLTIGIPVEASFASVLAFCKDVLNLDKIEKVISWKYGDTTETIRAFDGDKKKEKGEGAGSFYIPVGTSATVKRNKDGALSTAANAGTNKSLVVATVKQASAKLMGFNKPTESKSSDLLKGTTISKTLETGSGNNASGNGYKVFDKLGLYTLIMDQQKPDSDPVPLRPGTGLKVKARYSNKVSGRQRGLGDAPGAKLKSSSRHASFLMPTGTPISVVFEMLMNVPNRPASFQVSINGKSHGLSYNLPSKGRKATA